MNHYFTNEQLPSNVQKKIININEKSYSFYTDNGVFSKKGLDYGSRSLIMSLLNENISGDVLDLGCGYGVIGIVLASFFDINVDMVDVNLRAIHLAKRNIKENKVSNVTSFYSNIYDDVIKKYDFIVTNPPIRAGKETLYKFLLGAKEFLKPGGALYFVINKDQGAKSLYEEFSKNCKMEILSKNKGFFVFKCQF